MLTSSIFLHALTLSSAILTAANEPAAADDVKRRIELKSGISMAYREAGPRDAPPLIMLHGLGDTSRSWTLMLPDLSRSHRVYLLDQRGHGETAAPACCYALADFAYDVVTFMDAMKIDSAVIAGHSLGSFVAQHLASAYPSRVRRLILLASSDTTVGLEFIDWLWGKTLTFDTGIPNAFIDEWQSNPTPVKPDFLSKIKVETAAVPIHVWKNTARVLLTEDHRRFLSEVKTPALILWGEKDPAFPADCQERLRKALPHARFKSYPDVGHNPHWEIPGPIASEIEAFIRPAGPTQ